MTRGGRDASVGRHRDVAAPSAETLRWLRRARDLMDHRYAEPLDLDAMARAAGYSRFHFARSFRAAFGETPGAYLTRRRVERAKDLLRSANLTVTEVCWLVGFSSLGSFSARFSELVGMSPTAYRREQVARGGPPPVPGCFLMAWTRPRPGGAGGAGEASRAGGAGDAGAGGAEPSRRASDAPEGSEDTAIAEKRRPPRPA